MEREPNNNSTNKSEGFEFSPADKQLLLIEDLIGDLSDEICTFYGDGDPYHISRYKEYPLFGATEAQPELDEVISALKAIKEVESDVSLSEDQKKEAMVSHFEVLRKYQV